MKTILFFTAIFCFIVTATSVLNYRDKFNSVFDSIESDIAQDLIDPQPLVIKRRLLSLRGLGFDKVEIFPGSSPIVPKNRMFFLKKEITLDGFKLGTVVDNNDFLSIVMFTISSPVTFLIIFGIYLLLVYLIVYPLVGYKKSVENFITNFDGNFSDSKHNDSVTEKIRQILKKNVDQAEANASLIQKNQKNEEIFRLSQKLAHDIRSPISTLNLVSAKITDPDLKYLAQAAAGQINDISNSLLIKSKEELSSKVESGSLAQSKTNSVTEATNEGLLRGSIELFLKEAETELSFKREIIKRNLVFEIDQNLAFDSRPNGTFDVSVLKRCFNNFVQNAIEATNQNGRILISAFATQGRIELNIIDDGKGIPNSILQKLGSERLTFGKENLPYAHVAGSGIAIYNAKRDLAEMGAELRIYSVENKGTTISVVI